ncbi:hypothetical protein FNV43_RR02842 [Rhamnella rubrinervis]|uniref:DUF7903 domain-containing protein n=1 Tax=Rhamnella rubrinervis TaxID=2594499 RepID=A0A8K0HHR5_9ROSA|nr:hypothetical protein FNV43_RR02842 [Rhamnella rubrinervis]
MAYIPPHKRHSEGTERPSPCPEQLAPQFNKNLKLRSSSSKVLKGGKIIYADQAISRWCAIGLGDGDQFPPSVLLEPVSLDSIERKNGEKPLALFNTDIESDKVRGNFSTSPWLSIAENVLPDLVSSFENVRNEIDSQKLEVKTTLVARFGKILFHVSPSVDYESIRKSVVADTTLRQLKRSFYTNIPTSYMDYMVKEVVPEIGLDFAEEKDIYHVKLFDSTKPDSTISCKCIVRKEHGSLQFYKVELNQVRHMVMDVSCLEKNLDLRLMLCTKSIITVLSDDELQSIRDLINSAVLDTSVKGGLRWPLGKASVGKYTVVGVWHTIAKSYKNPSVRLKLRHADRFDFRTSIGETSKEINLKLKGVASKLHEQQGDISEMIKDDLRMIWNNLLCCERYLT